MISILTAMVSWIGRKAALWGAFAVAIGAALWIAFRRGRLEAEAEFMIRRADARIRSLQTAKEVSHEVQNADRAELERRLDRWMRD
jgi:high-affinity Fe2+/Pb2+ permease